MGRKRWLSSLSEENNVLLNKLISGDRLSLSKAITLAESSRLDHRKTIMIIIENILERDQSKSSIRLGITGPPGAGKSTFIEILGNALVNQGHKIAVLPIDPSSHTTGGSILGDKTRMPTLSLSENVYIRPTPARGILGGIAEYTADTVLLCEAAGYNIIIIESVGTGQSEVELESAVDMTLLLLPPGGGDELQAAKKGVVESADAILCTKADGPYLQSAKATLSEYKYSLSFSQSRKYGSDLWQIPVLLVSSKTGDGLAEVIATINKFQTIMQTSGLFERKRAEQSIYWMWIQSKRLLLSKFLSNPAVKANSLCLEEDVRLRKMSPHKAAEELYNIFKGHNIGDNG